MSFDFFSEDGWLLGHIIWSSACFLSFAFMNLRVVRWIEEMDRSDSRLL